MSLLVTERMRDLCCADRVRMGKVRARKTAESARAFGRDISPFHCPFCGWWHVAKPPSMDRVAEIALAIRDLHGNAPAPVLVTA